MSDLLDPAHCSQSAEWSVGFPAAVCDETVNFHRLAFNNPSPSSLVAKNVILTNSHGIKKTVFATFRSHIVVEEAVICFCFLTCVDIYWCLEGTAVEILQQLKMPSGTNCRE